MFLLIFFIVASGTMREESGGRRTPHLRRPSVNQLIQNVIAGSAAGVDLEVSMLLGMKALMRDTEDDSTLT